MIITSLDVRVVGELTAQTTNREADHFMVFYVDGKEVVESARVPREPAPQWEVQKELRFDLSSQIRIMIYRRSLLKRFPLKKNLVAEYTGLGIDLLDENVEHELVGESGHTIAPHLSIHLNLAIESHTQFMMTVDKDIARLEAVKGSDALQAATSIASQLGTVLQKIVPLIDNFASTHPILNAAWIVLSSAYKVLQNQVQEDDAVRELVERLREMAGAASSCADLSEIEGTIVVIEEIGRISLEAAQIVHDYAKPSIRGKASIAARTAKHPLSDISSRIARCQKRCIELTEILDRRVHFDTNARVKGIQDVQMEREIDIWMDAPDTSPNYNAARKKHHPETGSWFLNGSAFTRWKEHSDFLLWLHGGPGSGKTILCSSAIQAIIDFCDSRPSVGYAYFLFDGRSADDALLVHEKLLRSIIMQLARRCDGIPQVLIEMYNKCDKGLRQPPVKLLEDTLLRIVDSFKKVYIIIDSLDECSERKDLVQWIQSTSGASEKLHMMATSRAEPEIMRGLRSLSHLQEICVSGQQMETDIRCYIEARLAESDADKWRQVQKDMIIEALVTGADGMWRWVALQSDRLMRCASQRELETQIKSLPRDLDQLYSRILAESSDPGTLKRILQWLAYARRPMAVEEIAEVAVIHFGDDDSGLPVYEADRRYEDPRHVLSLCYGLVVEVEVSDESIIESHWGNTSVIKTLKLAHFSVKEYLMSQLVLSGAALNLPTAEQLSHSVIAQTCVAYLLHFDRPDSISYDNLASFPLAQYAATHLQPHIYYVRSELDNAAALQKLLLHLLRPPPSYAMLNCLRLYNPDIPWGGVNFDNTIDHFASLLYYACCTGAHSAAEDLINTGADINAAGGNYGTPLIAASTGGHLKIVQLLLAHASDVNINGPFSTALTSASSCGHFEVVQLLLTHGAKINTDTGGSTALQAASSQGHLEVARLLLKNHADVNIGGEHNGTALTLASSHGHFELVQLLLAHGADVNARIGFRDVNALEEASSGGHLAIVQVLLAHGADVNARGRFLPVPALKAAFSNGHTAIVELLQEHGAVYIDSDEGHFEASAPSSLKEAESDSESDT